MEEQKNENAEKQAEKPKPYRWGVTESGVLAIEVSLENPHLAVGIISDAKQYLLDLIATQRIQKEIEDRKKKDIIEGRDPMAREAVKDKSFFKKHFMK